MTAANPQTATPAAAATAPSAPGPISSETISPGPLLAMSGSYWSGCTLHAGVVLDVFSPLADGPATPQELAPRLGCDARALGMLLRALCALGLLRRSAGAYGLTEAARQFLLPTSPRSLCHIIRHHHHLVESFARLHESVRTGRANRPGVGQGDTAREDFLLGMFNLAMGIAPGLAARLGGLLTAAGLPGLAARGRVLDLGGGPGTYAIQFCLANPGLTATIFDLPGTRPIAEATVARFGLPFGPGGRVDFHPGDYTTDPLPGGFTLAWLSQILHGEDPATATDLVRRAAEALVPGGVLLVHEFLLNDPKDDPKDGPKDGQKDGGQGSGQDGGGQDGPAFAALFSLNMLLGTPGGQAYAEGEVGRMMEAAGLTRVRRLDFAGPNESRIIAGMKPE